LNLKIFTFPLNCFAKIISKSQGESLKEVGIDLSKEYLSCIWLAQKLVMQKAYIYQCPQERRNKCSL
jgi:hypothetical protein